MVANEETFQHEELWNVAEQELHIKDPGVAKDQPKLPQVVDMGEDTINPRGDIVDPHEELFQVGEGGDSLDHLLRTLEHPLVNIHEGEVGQLHQVPGGKVGVEVHIQSLELRVFHH